MRRTGSQSAALLAGVLLALSPVSGAGAFPLDGSLPIIQRPKFDPGTEYAAGMAALTDRNYRDAKSHFEHVLFVAPDHPLALYGVGVAESALGDLRGAARDYQKALSSDPNLIDAARRLALTDDRLGRGDQARLQLERLRRLAETCASACAKAADIAAAITEVEAALSAPTSPAKPPAG